MYCRLSDGGKFGAEHVVDDVTFTFMDNGTQVQAVDFNGDSMADWMAMTETGDL